MTEARARLRAMLAGDGMILAPFVYDCIQARLAQAAGFEAVYMTGFGTSAARGYPDLGLLTMTEMVDNVRAISSAVDVPVISDADTGYGNPVNVWRTVREYEAAGAAALHIEDQVFPKRCGFLAGKEVIAADEMVAKVRAAREARRDPRLVIIARTDALAIKGWDDVIRRCHAYRDAGADLLFVDGIKSVGDLQTYATRLQGMPLVYNGAMLPAAELARLGFKVTIHIGTMMASFERMRDAMAELKNDGRVKGAGLGVFDDFVELMGTREIDALGKKYRG